MLRAILWRLAAAALPLTTGVLGVLHGPDDWRSAATLGQHLSAVGSMAYGPLGLAAGAALLWGRPGARSLLLLWIFPLVLTGTVAPVVWGETSLVVGLVSGVATLLICWGAWWLGDHALRGSLHPPTGKP